MFRAGLLDFISFYHANEAKKYERLGYEIQKRGQNLVWLLALNNGKAPLDDPNLRRAIYYAIDQRAYAGLFGNKDFIAEGYLPYGIVGSIAPSKQGRFHLKTAQKYLSRSKYRGQWITIELPLGIFDIAKQKAFFEKQLKRAGINVRVRLRDFSTIWAKQIVTKKFDAYLVAIAANYPDPDGFLDIYFRSDRVFNLANYKNSEMNQLLSQGRQALVNKERFSIYRQIEEKLKKEAVIVPLYHENFWGAWHKDIKTVKLNSLGEFCFLLKDIAFEKKEKNQRMAQE